MQHLQPEGFLAMPAGGTGQPALVLHAWWGLNDTIRSLCERLAAEGFAVFAPDLYHGVTADTPEEAEALATALDADSASAQAAQAAAFIHERCGVPAAGVAVIGLSLGAFYALELAAREPDRVSAVVLFYGTGPADPGRSRAAFLGHFASSDPFEPLENVQALEAMLRQAGRPVTFYHYEGTGHWFFEPDRAQAYHAQAAALAWERTLAFLKRGHIS
jgi:carboxymethylenebutenolidase